MRTILLVFVICICNVSVKADTITLYFDFELEKNEKLCVFSGTKLIYSSKYPGTIMFDSVKITNDSVKPEIIIRRFGLRYSEKYIHTNWQQLPGYSKVLIYQTEAMKKSNFAFVTYHTTSLQRPYRCYHKKGIRAFFRSVYYWIRNL